MLAQDLTGQPPLASIDGYRAPRIFVVVADRSLTSDENRIVMGADPVSRVVTETTR